MQYLMGRCSSRVTLFWFLWWLHIAGWSLRMPTVLIMSTLLCYQPVVTCMIEKHLCIKNVIKYMVIFPHSTLQKRYHN